MNQFAVGKTYQWAEPGYDSFTVLSRTAKTITVSNGTSAWRMLVHTDDRGEWVCDSSQPRSYRDAFVSIPKWMLNNGAYGYRIKMVNNLGKTITLGQGDLETIDRAITQAQWIMGHLPTYYPDYHIESAFVTLDNTRIKTIK